MTDPNACPTCGTPTRRSRAGHAALCFDCSAGECLIAAGWLTFDGSWRSPDPDDDRAYTTTGAWNEHTEQRLTHTRKRANR